MTTFKHHPQRTSTGSPLRDQGTVRHLFAIANPPIPYRRVPPFSNPMWIDGVFGTAAAAVIVAGASTFTINTISGHADPEASWARTEIHIGAAVIAAGLFVVTFALLAALLTSIVSLPGSLVPWAGGLILAVAVAGQFKDTTWQLALAPVACITTTGMTGLIGITIVERITPTGRNWIGTPTTTSEL